MSQKIVAVALSGGVDSAAAAYLLKQSGYEVIGVHMSLFNSKNNPRIDSNSSPDKLAVEVRAICHKLGIPFHLIDLREPFREYVINYFTSEYISGRTPNPCVACNRYIKFGFLFQKLSDLKIDYLATGHYASIEYNDGGYHLLAARDKKKDQTYVLYSMNQEKLAQVLFPVAKYRKNEVLALAEEKQLLSSKRLSSQDICFINKKYTDFLKGLVRPVPGEIIDSSGNVIGKHRGVIYYTIGQRCGLGVATGQRLYVNKIDTQNNRITVGPEEELYRDSLVAGDLLWTAGKPPARTDNIGVKVRYGADMTYANIRIEGEYVHVSFRQPQKGISPGQSVVFYYGSELLGGGIIEYRP